MIKKIKLVIGLTIILVLAITVFQNRAFIIDQTNGLEIDLFFTQYTVPEQPIYVYCLGCFVFGFLFGSYFTLVKHFRARRIIKDRDSQIETLRKSLESERNEPTIDVAEETSSTSASMA
ncbi:MAG: LapA family protein [Candidatus Magnetomorum sp.]|nr:LapA family protein [Candidatus Magnetomorum sp.]